MITTTTQICSNEVLRGCEAFIAEHGYPPTVRELQKHLGHSSSSVTDRYLRLLENQGRIARTPGLSRTLRVLRPIGGAR